MSHIYNTRSKAKLASVPTPITPETNTTHSATASMSPQNAKALIDVSSVGQEGSAAGKAGESPIRILDLLLHSIQLICDLLSFHDRIA